MNNFRDIGWHLGSVIGKALSGCAIAAMLTAAPARAEADRHVTLDYSVYVGGFETITFSLTTELRATDYKINMALDGQGILNWWFSWSVKAFSEGRLADGALVPVRSGADSNWNGTQRRSRLIYGEDGAPSVTIRPPADNDDRDVVPPELRSGAKDPFSAVFAGLSRLNDGLDNGGACAAREAVFDGRRRYNLVLNHLGRDVIERNNYSPFSGPALRCAIKIERVAGFRRKPTRMKWRKTDGATLWIGRAFTNFPPVPVRMELETVLGGFRAHLVRATIKEGGQIRRLAMVR